jgi:ADP-ribose pyrophosphatase YjhB (NUDIX family)
MRTRVIVSAIIVKNGRFLLGKKPRNIGPYPNTWHLIGGGVKDGGESLVDAIKREVKEEAGITITGITPLYFDEDITLNKHKEKVHYYFHYFRVTPKGGRLKPADDIVELRWFSKKELRRIPLPKVSKKHLGEWVA